MQIELPWPPSTNRIWRNVKGKTLLSAEGRQFRELAARYCVIAGAAGKRLSGQLSVTVVAYAPDRRRRDLDNLLKPTLDALTHAGVWGDDSQVSDLRIRWGENCKGGKLVVLITRN